MRRLALLGLLCFGCASAPPPAPPAPAWFDHPPTAEDTYFFVGNVTAAESSEKARDLAVQKAMAELVAFVGAKVQSEERSIQREDNGVDQQHVSVSVEISGAPVSLRGVAVKSAEVLPSGKGFDGYALLAWPKAEREALVKEAGLRGERALALYVAAVKAFGAVAFNQAAQGVDAALALLGAGGPVAPLEDPELKNTELLRAALESMKARIAAEQTTRRQVCALGLRCLKDGASVPCKSNHQSLFATQITEAGRTLAPEEVSGDHVAAILGGGEVAPEPGWARIGCVVAVELISENLGKTGPFYFGRGSGRAAIYDVTTRQIVSSARSKPDKVGHISSEEVVEKAFEHAEKELAPEILRALQGPAPFQGPPAP
ncbi:MAG: hypothetical protein U1E65_35685 [Myxococcota bacterium]